MVQSLSAFFKTKTLVMILKKNYKINDHLSSENITARRSPKFLLPISFLLLTFTIMSCNKLVEIDPPVNTIVTSQVFASDANANAAVLGIYSQMTSKQANLRFSNGALTIFSGLSSDEMATLLPSASYQQFYLNKLTNTNSFIYSNIWIPAYSYIYQINASIEGLINSHAVSNQVKEQLTAELKFLRAFTYFYLVNLFGEVPNIQSTDWTVTQSVARSSKTDIYELIVNDLLEAESKLPNDYSKSNNERVLANSLAAKALLARVYLYNGKWDEAENLTTSLITNPLFELKANPNDVFKKNSKEAILQWYISSDIDPFNATPEGNLIVPFDQLSPARFYLSKSLLQSFENGDLRFLSWVDSTEYNGVYYYYPYKYKIGPKQVAPNTPTTEYYMVLRFAEQYLIRSEARAKKGNLTGAINDLNIIRNRAGLPQLLLNLNESQVLSAIEKENKIEFFAEWGHRWLDLKRTLRIKNVMTLEAVTKGSTWDDNWSLYPIPFRELQTNPNLIQNNGY
jgi:starch-binding outer membrane protein, SusD/RagB family